MKSIKKNIVRTSTLIPAVILFSVFITIDIVLDDWVNNKFDETLTIKSNYLKSLITVNQTGVEFDFSGEFMPEFKRKKDAQYFQLWADEKPFNSSKSLLHFPEEQLAKTPLTLNSSKIIDVILPDGRDGRAIMSYFSPQVPEQLRSTIPYYQHTVFLTVGVSREEFSQALIALDIIFWLLFITFIIGIRYLVTVQIDNGLKPLNRLNEQIANLKIDKSASSLPQEEDQYIELTAIRAELTHFIKLSQQTLKDEQRLSADIAHELKTPISEIISLSELHVKYPEDLRISESYPEDMLSIAQRMKHIVNNLMMLNQNDQFLLKQQNKKVVPQHAINELLESIQGTDADVFQRVQISDSIGEITINLDIISFNIIMVNLINNALFYSPAQSQVNLQIATSVEGYLQITIHNELKHPVSAEQLTQIFKPLYKIDKARTEDSHYGLGLAISKKLCDVNGYQINASCPNEKRIEFSLLLSNRLLSHEN